MANLSVSLAANEWLGGEHEGRGAIFRALLLNEPYYYMHLVPLCEFWVGGKANVAKRDIYTMCAIEKPIRTASHVGEGHVSSFQSRVPDKLFAGAFKFRALIPELGREAWIFFSISGMPELGDEAAGLETAALMNVRGWTVNLSDLRQVLKISGNTIFKGEPHAT